jgi:hypothetical protein
MPAQTLPTFWIAMLCIVALLCVQLSGLHQHHHVDLDGSGSMHAVQLHFEDVGWHGGEPSGAHRHAAAADLSHPHLDIETRVAKDVLAKVFSVVLLCLLFGWAVIPWQRNGADLPRPSQLPRTFRRSRFDGPPPSQAPPRFLSRTS